jgi:tetratricopeptide (TPR) repeat protein/tRNA A-37 threonylcarbamoyl transferase component Bud32
MLEFGAMPFQLDRYSLQDRLGEGATAVVYAAYDRELKRDVAVKVLRETMGMSEIARERFRREAQAAAGLSHPNLVTVYDAGTSDGQSYLVMERVQGKSLEDCLRGRRPALQELVRILERASRGVAAAHEKGIVHRDLKPANILMSTSGDPKVGDFGMAHLMDSRVELTKTGVPLGTPLYMAPEQVQGRTQDITPRTDVYGLGAILYEALTGRPPHLADGIAELYGKISNDDPARPTRLNPAAPPELEAVALKALDKDPDRRYADAAGFADDLARYLAGKPVEARSASVAFRAWRRLKKHRIAVVSGAAAALVVVGVALAGQHRARALEAERGRDLRAAEESQKASRRREESLKRLSNLWARMVTVLEWRQQPARKSAEIRQELDGLLQEVSTYIADYPDQPQGYYVRARARHSSGDYPKAAADLILALDRHPDFSPGWALLAQAKLDLYVERIYAWSERERERSKKAAAPILREAEEALRRCEGGAPGKAASERWGLSWTRADIIQETVMLALKERYLHDNREAASKRLQEANQKSPAAEYCDLIGVWSGDVDKVAPWLDQAITLAPHWPRPYVNRAIVWKVKGDAKKALDELTKAIEINPTYALAYDFRGWYRCQGNDLDGAIEDCGRALELDPGKADAYVHRAEARRLKGDRLGAIEDATKAIGLDPAMALGWAVRGHAALELGDAGRAFPDLNKAIELAPEEWHVRAHRAMVFALRGDFDRMDLDCDHVLKVAPADSPHRVLAQQLKEQARRLRKNP